MALSDALRLPLPQVTQLLQNFVKACPDCPSVVEACVAFALATAHRDNSYATWLYDVAVNASRTAVLDVVRHIHTLFMSTNITSFPQIVV